MRIRTLSIVLTSTLFFTQSTQATIYFSTSFKSWQEQITTHHSKDLEQASFKTNYANISATIPSGISALPDPSDPSYSSARLDWHNSANNIDLGRTAVFNRDDTNLPWDFEIGAIEKHTVGTSSSTTHGTEYNPGEVLEAHIIYNDRIKRDKFDQVNAFTDVLSIGKARGYDTKEVPNGDPYNWDNDDFRISITSGPELFALAFEIINNKKYLDSTINPDKPQSSDGGLYSYGREAISIGDSGNNVYQIKETTGQLPIIPGYYNDPATPEDEGRYEDNFDDVQFIGIVSDTAINWLEFNEDSRSDNIGIRNLMFAGSVSAVPLPAGFWLLFSALLALMRFKSKQNSVG